MEGEVTAAIIAASVAFFANGLLHFASRSHEQQQLARPILIRPAEEYAEAVMKAMATLRYVTPPELTEDEAQPHRNEELLERRKDKRGERLNASAEAVDAVRFARARVLMVFRPHSPPVRRAGQLLGVLRGILETAELYYVENDKAMTSGDHEVWRANAGAQLRDAYKTRRKVAYELLNVFAAAVAGRLSKPTWKPSGEESREREVRKYPDECIPEMQRKPALPLPTGGPVVESLSRPERAEPIADN